MGSLDVRPVFSSRDPVIVAAVSLAMGAQDLCYGELTFDELGANGDRLSVLPVPCSCSQREKRERTYSARCCCFTNFLFVKIWLELLCEKKLFLSSHSKY